MIYFSYLKMHFKKLMQYRLSFLLSLISQTLVSVSALFVIYVLFEKFHVVAGWTFSQVCISYAVSYFCFSFTECFFRGVDTFAKLVKSGKLDGMLIRPRSVLGQVICADIEFSKIGRLIVALCILVYACISTQIMWTFFKVAVLLFMLVCGVVVFFSVFLFGASLSIYTIEGTEVVNIFTDGGRELCQYPINIYGKFIKTFFCFVIPLACFNYLPMMFLFDMPGATLFKNAFTPLYGMIIIVPALLFFRFSIKKYASTGT